MPAGVLVPNVTVMGTICFHELWMKAWRGEQRPTSPRAKSESQRVTEEMAGQQGITSHVSVLMEPDE